MNSPQDLLNTVESLLGAPPQTRFDVPDGLLAMTDSRIAFASADPGRASNVVLSTDKIERYWYDAGTKRVHVRDSEGKEVWFNVEETQAPQTIRQIKDFSGKSPDSRDQSGVK